jgi:ankyrin repeat protein
MPEGRDGTGRRAMRSLRRRGLGLPLGFLVIGLSQMASSQTPDSVRAMLEAAARGEVDTLQRLIAAGAALESANAAGETPLLLAVKNNHLSAAVLLIDAGSNINARAANRDSPWLLAGALGRTEMLRHMIPKGPDFSVRNRFGGNALIPACERAHVDAVKVLLTTKIDVNHINDLGWTCLLEIVILGDGGPRHVEVAKRVLAAGADPKIADKDGVSPLTHARRKGQTEIARLIEAAAARYKDQQRKQ